MATKKKPARKPRKLKLYVWEGVLCDYTSGAMWALAYSVEQARELVRESVGLDKDDINLEPQVITKPEGFHVHGGG
jgi:hypothetical protein